MAYSTGDGGYSKLDVQIKAYLQGELDQFIMVQSKFKFLFHVS